MPAAHLASQAPQGSSVLQQLDALATLHARIRQGPPRPAAELQVTAADLQPGHKLFMGASELSPAGDCALIVCTEPELGRGARVISRDGNGECWSCPLPLNAPCYGCMASWSRCGGFCALLGEGEVQGCLRVYVFSAHQRCWLPSLPVPGVLHLERARFSHAGSPPLAAAMCRAADTPRHALVVFRATQAGVCVKHCAPGSSFVWLPGSDSIALLQHHQLARLDITQDLTFVTSASVPLPVRSLDYTDMDACPAGQSVWVVQALSASKSPTGRRCFSLSVFAAADIDYLDSWTLEEPEAEGAAVLDLACHAIAVLLRLVCICCV